MIYFDNAATTFPKPQAVYNEVFKCMTQYCGNPGRGSHKMSLAAAEAIYNCRMEIAEMFHSDSPENVVFTMNTTYALNMAIRAFAKSGDHVVTSVFEHNSVSRPLYAIGADVTKAKNIVSAVSSTLPSAVIASHASNICGMKTPLGTVGRTCEKYDIPFIVDAAQSAGHYDIDISDAAAICVPGHKGLYGVQGCGFILFNKRYAAEKLLNSIPLIQGGSGVNSLESAMPSLMPEHFEAGTLNTPAIAGLCEGIRHIRKIGIDAIRVHEEGLCSRLRDMLMNTKGITVYAPEYDGPVLLFNIENMPSSAVGDKLNSHNICVRSGFHCAPEAHRFLNTGNDGAVRVSFGIYNTADEVEYFWKVLKLILNGE